MLYTLILSVLATSAAVSFEANRPYLDMWNAYVNNSAAAAKYGLQEACKPRRVAATQPYRGTALLFHGFSACPQQYFALAPLLAAQGFDVLLPLTPGHGNAVNHSGIPSADHCIYGCDHVEQVDDTTGLPNTTVGYALFVHRMNDIMQHATGERVVAGLSLGGALAAAAANSELNIFARTLVMNPLLKLSNALEDYGEQLLDLVPGVRQKYAGWGHECTMERQHGRAGICTFRVDQAAAARNFGYATLRSMRRAAPGSDVAVIYDHQDNTVSTASARNLSTEANASSCVLNFTQHSFLSTYDDLNVNKWWLNEVSCRIVDYLANGIPFPVVAARDADEGNDHYCELQCSATRCPLNMSDVHAPLHCPYQPPPALL